MEEYDVNVDHAKHSIGGDFGHVIRRVTHVSMVIIPLLYYSHGHTIAANLSPWTLKNSSASCACP